MKTTPRLLTAEERSAIMSDAMKTWWANRKAAEAKAERKAKREAKKAQQEALSRPTLLEAVTGKKPVGASGVKVKLPRGTKVEGGKVKMPSRDIGRTQPQKYAAKTKKTWRKAG
jgi:hypothetical protein